jgi:GNAT superfamily N-acetyltransferase
MTLRYLTLEGYPSWETAERICAIPSDAARFPIETFERRLKHQYRILVCFCLDEDNLVAYKIGYESRPKYFESWMGAVEPVHRRNGIARQLLTLQHQWCIDNDYRFITTISDASNRAMLILNLQEGFIISGTLNDRGENHQVLLQKEINIEEEDV